MAKQQAKQRVKLREDKTTENRLSLFLDWSKDNKRHREYIKKFVFEKPTTIFEHQHNKQTYYEAELLRVKRENDFNHGEIEEIKKSSNLKSRDFYGHFEEYLDKYQKKDKRMMKATYEAFKTFAPPPLTSNDVDETLILNFREYLTSTYKGETPQSYFARFKKFIAYSSNGNKKIFKLNPAKDIKNERSKTSKSIPKDVLTIEELQKLNNAKCGNEQVKMAFMFACNTGLGFTDIQSIKWADIKENSILPLTATRSKTKVEFDIYLNDNAKAFLPARGKDEDFIFKLPSNNSTNDNLKNWAKRAGIEKKITFYVARHTFGTLLFYYKTDILTISKLLGHTSLKHTTKYTQVADIQKKDAVNSIPNF